MEIMTLDEAAWKIRNGGVVAYPTETVYGLGAVMYEKEAVMRIKKLKGIAPDKPLSVIISDNRREMLEEIVDSMLPVAQRLIKFFWPGPLTIIHEAKKTVPDFITGGTGFVGLRCSPLSTVNDLLDRVGHPIVSTSANPTGKPPAENYEQLFSYFKDDIDGALIFDGSNGELKSEDNVPSTIVKVDFHKTEIIREGAISADYIHSKIYE